MASAEEEAKERAVFDDDDDEEEDDDSADGDGDGDGDADVPAAAAAVAPPPPPLPREAERPTDSTAASSAGADDDDAAPTTSGPSPNANRGGGASAAGAGEEGRRVSQRLWTSEEELVILRGFAEFTARRGTAFAAHQPDTAPFYDEMRRRLPLAFSRSQLVEKLRRLKKKYLTCVARLRSAPDSFAFRSPHEQALFEIARNIWTPSPTPDLNPDLHTPNPYNSNHSDADRSNPPPSRSRSQRRRRRAPAPAAAEDPITANSELNSENPPLKQSPPPPPPPLPPPPPPPQDLSSLLIKELVGAAVGAPLLGGLGGRSGGGLVNNSGDGRWREQQILELEVYLKRLELLREHVESTLRELKGSSGGA